MEFILRPCKSEIIIQTCFPCISWHIDVSNNEKAFKTLVNSCVKYGGNSNSFFIIKSVFMSNNIKYQILL